MSAGTCVDEYKKFVCQIEIIFSANNSKYEIANHL